MTSKVDTMPMRIGGQRRGSSTGEVIDAINPATGDLIARIPNASDSDVDEAVSVAQQAFLSWRRTQPSERAAALHSFADLITKHGEELALLDSLDNGTPLRELRNDVAAAVSQLRYYAGLILQVRGETVPGPWERVNYTLRQPYGVCVRIIPFNHPLVFAASKIAAPVAAGNAVIIKPSEYTSVSALRIAELADQAFPPGVVTVVTGNGASAGDALVRHPLTRRLAFIGSSATGRRILRRANEHNVKMVTLELGGKNPLVVFPDADLDKAVAAAVRGMNFSWQGQSCGSTSRLLVHTEIYDNFVERLSAILESMRSGSPQNEDTEIGAIVNKPQYEKVKTYLEIGREEGARVVAGGYALTDGEFARGFFIRPTIFADVASDSRLAQEEIFGPVLAAMRFTDYDDAIRMANGVSYGLTAGVFTGDLTTAHRFVRDIEAGYVWVNDVSRHTPGTSFGGIKNSGLGREEDLEELYSYTESKNVHINFGG